MIRNRLQSRDNGISPVAGVILMVAMTVAVATLIIAGGLLIPLGVANLVDLTPYAIPIVSAVLLIQVLRYVEMYHSQKNTSFEDIVTVEDTTDTEEGKKYKARISNLGFKSRLGEQLIVAPVGENPKNWEFQATLNKSKDTVTFKQTGEDDGDDVFVADKSYGELGAKFKQLTGIAVYNTDYEEVARIET